MSRQSSPGQHWSNSSSVQLHHHLLTETLFDSKFLHGSKHVDMAIQAMKAYQAENPAANSQCPSLSVARGFKACQEHSANLWHEHIIAHQLPSLRILQAQQLPSYRVSQRLWIHLSELSQQIPYDDMDSFQILLSLACSLSWQPKGYFRSSASQKVCQGLLEEAPLHTAFSVRECRELAI